MFKWTKSVLKVAYAFNEHTIYSLQMHGTTEGSIPFMLEKILYLFQFIKIRVKQCEKSNYRPISVLSCMSKIREKIICKSLYKYCVFHGLLINNESGFKWNNSTVNQLFAKTHNMILVKTFVIFSLMYQHLLIRS